MTSDPGAPRPDPPLPASPGFAPAPGGRVLPPVPEDGLPAEAFRTVTPAYGAGSLADVMPSVSAVLGVPGAPDVLGLGERLAGVDRIGVLLVDGLGAYQLPTAAPFAPTLASLSGPTLTTGFPSTTPVSLVTVGTGAPPGAHGILGFTVRRPDGRTLNHIHWGDDPDPYQWQPLPTAFETAAAAGVAVTLVSRSLYRGSGLSVAAHRGARYHVADDGPAVAEGMLAALRSGPGLVYGYHPDLDKAGHEYGVASSAWQDAARGVDAILDRLVHELPPTAALLVIADHGQLNVPATDRYDLSTGPLAAGLAGVSGEPRARYLHVLDGALDDVQATWQGVLGADARVMRRDEAIAEGWYGPVAPAHKDRIGDLVVLCLNRAVVVASAWEPPMAGQLVAYHGSVTAAEMTVPLLIVR
ncbi:alkaline phosphatase family protein [Actinoplanes sp. CA-252034]|uniref:alkaline phosphatase family protein n=1 Tax=Actinoplanes sp. CA-252034 TaxID=3239906 RepID=UPI003D9900A6